MRRSQYSEEQIIAILKEPKAGKPIRELCREHGLTDQTYYPAGAVGSAAA